MVHAYTGEPTLSAEFAQEKLSEAFPDCAPCFSPSQLLFYAWPQTFGSTAGPFRGVGGQAMTVFTIEAWASDFIAMVFCDGNVLSITDRFTPGSWKPNE